MKDLSNSKVLLLTRHAKSSWKNASLSDFDRPLNKRGTHDAPKMGKHLAHSDYVPEAIMTSTAVRALTTAELIAAETGIAKHDIIQSEKIYGIYWTELLDEIKLFDNSFRVLMVVGHNPTITELLNKLTNKRIDNVPTCGVAVLGFNTSSWSGIKRGEGELITFDYPKKFW